jgi:hypothetical protein
MSATVPDFAGVSIVHDRRICGIKVDVRENLHLIIKVILSTLNFYECAE